MEQCCVRAIRRMWGKVTKALHEKGPEGQPSEVVSKGGVCKCGRTLLVRTEARFKSYVKL